VVEPHHHQHLPRRDQTSTPSARGRSPGDPDRVLPPSPGADVASAAETLPDHVQDALRRLPEEYRAAVVLRDVIGRSYEEIGEILDVPVGTVRSRIHRGRALLRKALT